MMANKFFTIVLALLCFSAGLAIFATLMGYMGTPAGIPEAMTDVLEEYQAPDLEKYTNVPGGPLTASVVMFLLSTGWVLSLVVKTLGLLPLFVAMGVPSFIATPVSGIIGVLGIFFIFYLWTGRDVT